jgi:transposase
MSPGAEDFDVAYLVLSGTTTAARCPELLRGLVGLGFSTVIAVPTPNALRVIAPRDLADVEGVQVVESYFDLPRCCGITRSRSAWIPALSGAPPAGVRVLIATRPVDFRRGADGLAATVQSVLQQDPFCGTVFVFRSKRADRVKMLVYDGTGLVLIWKRLEGAKFKWPAISDGVMRLSAAQLAALFEGLDWRRVYAPRIRRPQLAG